MKHLGLLFLLSCLVTYTAASQSKNAIEKQQIVNAVGNEYQQGTVQTFNERYEGVRGSPFLSDRWVDGKVYMRNGHVFDELKIKYDLYRDEITVKRKDGAEVIPEKSRVQRFVLGPTSASDSVRFVRIDYLSNNRKFPPNHFAEILYEGQSTLLAVHHKKLIRADYRGAYHADRPYDMFGDVMTEYYFVASDGHSDKLKPNLKHITRLLKDKKDAMKQFVAKEGIDFEQPGDLVRLIRYYDQQD